MPKGNKVHVKSKQTLSNEYYLVFNIQIQQNSLWPINT
jgi:hypothetical protein